MKRKKPISYIEGFRKQLRCCQKLATHEALMTLVIKYNLLREAVVEFRQELRQKLAFLSLLSLLSSIPHDCLPW